MAKTAPLFTSRQRQADTQPGQPLQSGIDEDFLRRYLLAKHSESELIVIVRVALEVIGQKRINRQSAA